MLSPQFNIPDYLLICTEALAQNRERLRAASTCLRKVAVLRVVELLKTQLSGIVGRNPSQVIASLAWLQYVSGGHGEASRPAPPSAFSNPWAGSEDLRADVNKLIAGIQEGRIPPASENVIVKEAERVCDALCRAWIQLLNFQLEGAEYVKLDASLMPISMRPDLRYAFDECVSLDGIPHEMAAEVLSLAKREFFGDSPTFVLPLDIQLKAEAAWPNEKEIRVVRKKANE